MATKVVVYPFDLLHENFFLDFQGKPKEEVGPNVFTWPACQSQSELNIFLYYMLALHEWHLVHSSHIQRCQSFLEWVGLWIIWLESLPTKQSSCSTRSHEITKNTCMSLNYKNPDKKLMTTDLKTNYDAYPLL